MDNFTINYSRKISIILFLIVQITINNSGSHAAELPTGGELRPVGTAEYRVVEGFYGGGDGRRRLGPFQLCLLCRCCASGAATCSTMPCCFGIDCQLPNKPFGVCAFVPKTCSCTSCAV